MKKNTLLSLTLIGMFTCNISAKETTPKLSIDSISSIKPACPSTSEFQPIADSILAEGIQLYAYEKLNWMASDTLTTYFKNISEIGGSVVYGEPNDLRCIFTDKKRENVLFSGKGDVKTMQNGIEWDNKVRPMTAEEKEALEARRNCIKNLLAQYGDSIYNAPNAKGDLNIDVIKKKNGGYRLYILQGTTLPGMMPFGNDYIADFDKDFNNTFFQRCHKSFMATPVNSPDMDNFTHSHTPDNPYITVTDVCTCLLYGRDWFNIKSFAVLSTHFNSGFYISFDAEKMRIWGIDIEILKKIRKTK